MEIIRRINSDLIVENVMRYIVLMKKFEEEKAYRSKVGFFVYYSGRSKKSRIYRKFYGKFRLYSKIRVFKGDLLDGFYLDILGEREYDFCDFFIRAFREGCFIIEYKGDNFIMYSNTNVIEFYFFMILEWDVFGELVKRRIEMFFFEFFRGSFYLKVYRSYSYI